MSSDWRRARRRGGCPHTAAVQQQNGSGPATAPDRAREHGGGKRVLVVGGTGRVGASTVTALLKVRVLARVDQA